MFILVKILSNYIFSCLNSKNDKVDQNIHRRFYITLIIYELWKNKKSIWHVSNEFNIQRGFVQQIIQSSDSFTNGLIQFCGNLDELWPYKYLIKEFLKQLQSSYTQENLVEIMELDSVRLPRAQQLYNAGYVNIQLIAKAKPYELCKSLKNLPLNAAEKIVSSANVSFCIIIKYV